MNHIRPDAAEPDDRSRIPALASRASVPAALWILVALATVFTARMAEAVVVPVVSAVVLAIMLSPAAGFLERRCRLPRTLAAAIPLVGAIGFLFGALWLLVPATENWQERWPALVDEAERKLWRVTATLKDVKEATDKVKEAAGIGENQAAGSNGATVVIHQGGDPLLEMLSSTPAPLFGLFVAVVLALYFLRERRLAMRTIVAMTPVRRDRFRLARFCRTAQYNVTRYLLVVSAINVLVGAVTGLLFLAAGMPNAAIWGGAMALANFVPYLGPAVMVALAAMVGLITFPTLAAALVPPAGLVLINLVEANLLTPTLLGRRFSTSPITILVSVLFGAWLWGLAGAVLAVPMAVIALAAFSVRRSRPASPRSSGNPGTRWSPGR